MMDTRVFWPKWRETLRKQGLADIAAWALESAGPFNFLGAQALYLGQPFFSLFTTPGLKALACLLEEEDEAKAFAAVLKGKAL